jgi:hypothetical protein
MALYETFKNPSSISHWVCSKDELWTDAGYVENQNKMEDTQFFKSRKEALEFMAVSPYNNLKCEDVKMGKIRAEKDATGIIWIGNKRITR